MKSRSRSILDEEPSANPETLFTVGSACYLSFCYSEHRLLPSCFTWPPIRGQPSPRVRWKRPIAEIQRIPTVSSSLSTLWRAPSFLNLVRFFQTLPDSFRVVDLAVTQTSRSSVRISTRMIFGQVGLGSTRYEVIQRKSLAILFQLFVYFNLFNIF